MSPHPTTEKASSETPNSPQKEKEAGLSCRDQPRGSWLRPGLLLPHHTAFVKETDDHVFKTFISVHLCKCIEKVWKDTNQTVNSG